MHIPGLDLYMQFLVYNFTQVNVEIYLTKTCICLIVFHAETFLLFLFTFYDKRYRKFVINPTIITLLFHNFNMISQHVPLELME